EWLLVRVRRPASVVTWVTCVSIRARTQSHKVVVEPSTSRRQAMRKSSKVFVGMDVHKESIDITLAEEGGEVRRFGQIGGDRPALMRAVRKLTAHGRELVFVYEAGPCG